MSYIAGLVVPWWIWVSCYFDKWETAHVIGYCLGEDSSREYGELSSPEKKAAPNQMLPIFEPPTSMFPTSPHHLESLSHILWVPCSFSQNYFMVPISLLMYSAVYEIKSECGNILYHSIYLVFFRPFHLENSSFDYSSMPPISCPLFCLFFSVVSLNLILEWWRTCVTDPLYHFQLCPAI